MNSLDNFKGTKRQFKNGLITLDDLIEEIQAADDPSSVSSQLQKCRSNKNNMDQLIQKMQQEWELLDPNDKAQYKTKITKFKENYQKSKLRYRKVEDWIKTDEDRRKLNLKKSLNHKKNLIRVFKHL